MCPRRESLTTALGTSTSAPDGPEEAPTRAATPTYFSTATADDNQTNDSTYSNTANTDDTSPDDPTYSNARSLLNPAATALAPEPSPAAAAAEPAAAPDTALSNADRAAWALLFSLTAKKTPPLPEL